MRRTISRRGFLGLMGIAGVCVSSVHTPAVVRRVGLPSVQWRSIYPKGSYAGLPQSQIAELLAQTNQVLDEVRWIEVK